MKDRYVVDTNVLIAASAANPVDPKDIDATPREPELRMQVWQWLSEFESGHSRLVLDGAGKIYEEYGRRLGFNDYGVQVVIQKMSTAAADHLNIQFDRNGDAVLPGKLAGVVHDAADRKMVAAAISSHECFGEGCVAFAGDTDWHDWESELAKNNVLLEPIIEDWSRQTHAEKKKRKYAQKKTGKA